MWKECLSDNSAAAYIALFDTKWVITGPTVMDLIIQRLDIEGNETAAHPKAAGKAAQAPSPLEF